MLLSAGMEQTTVSMRSKVISYFELPRMVKFSVNSTVIIDSEGNNVNVERLEHLATLLDEGTYAEELHVGFDMSKFEQSAWRSLSPFKGDFEETRCIAGMAVRCYTSDEIVSSFFATAQQVLDLNDFSIAYDLFFPDPIEDKWHNIDPKDAAIVIRHLIQTGKADWSIVADKYAKSVSH